MNDDSQLRDPARVAGTNVASLRTLQRELNLFDVIAIVVGTVIGSGIFLIPSAIAAELNSLGIVLLVWVAGGILTLFGVLSLAELGSMYPVTGGLCTYLHHAYGPFVAFLYAWGLLLMIQAGSIAALAVAFATYMNHIVHLTPFDQKVLSVACILALTTINCFGIRGGKLTQNLIASAKIIGLAGIILLLCIRGSRPIHFFETPGVGGRAASLTGIGIALVAVMFAYEGWHVVSFVAGEMKRPQLDLPRGLVYGTVIVMLIYVAANFGYYRLLSPGEIRGSDALAAYAVGRVLGPGASIVISSLILISILGSMNGLVLTGPRAYFAMARNGAFPRVFGELSNQYRTPVIALIVQGGWAAVLAISGSYQQLFTAVIFTAWIFYGLAVAAVLVLRRTEPHIERRFRVPGYPWVSILFCAAAVGLVVSTVVERPRGAAIGVGLVATGIPVYFYLVRRSANRTPA